MTFKWSNYTKPTPKNLKLLMEFWKGLIVTLIVMSEANEFPSWVVITLPLLGYAVDKASIFFASVEEEHAKTTVQVEFPTAISDQVTVTQTDEKPNEFQVKDLPEK